MASLGDLLEFIVRLTSHPQTRDIERFSLDAGLDPDELWLYTPHVHAVRELGGPITERMSRR